MRDHEAPEYVSDSITRLLALIGKGYDIVHLLAVVSPVGIVTDSSGNTLSGTSLIQSCCDADVKLLWIASDNNAEDYLI